MLGVWGSLGNVVTKPAGGALMTAKEYLASRKPVLGPTALQSTREPSRAAMAGATALLNRYPARLRAPRMVMAEPRPLPREPSYDDGGPRLYQPRREGEDDPLLVAIKLGPEQHVMYLLDYHARLERNIVEWVMGASTELDGLSVRCPNLTRRLPRGWELQTDLSSVGMAG
jgi:hypothetical protein